MQSMRKYILLVVLGLAAISVGIRAFDLFSPTSKTGPETGQSVLCEEHGLKPGQCPFCDSSLIETQGFCAEHRVPEALCHRCRPELEGAFRKQGQARGPLPQPGALLQSSVKMLVHDLVHEQIRVATDR